jgi:Tfp pilus assembly protein PilX
MMLMFIVVVSFLVGSVMLLVFHQSRISEGKVRRIMASYAANAGIHYAMERLRLDTANVFNPNNAYCMSGDALLLGSAFCSGATPWPLAGTPDLNLVMQEDRLAFNITVRIGSMGSASPTGFAYFDSRPVTSRVDFTHTP